MADPSKIWPRGSQRQVNCKGEHHLWLGSVNSTRETPDASRYTCCDNYTSCSCGSWPTDHSRPTNVLWHVPQTPPAWASTTSGRGREARRPTPPIEGTQKGLARCASSGQGRGNDGSLLAVGRTGGPAHPLGPFGSALNRQQRHSSWSSSTRSGRFGKGSPMSQLQCFWSTGSTT